jgi:septal ring factor EnvC (AmiA/AmiB activator)
LTVNSEYERSLAKEIKDLRSAIKILETQKTQILKDSDEINKCIGYLSSNPEITESLLLSQMEQNRPVYCEMLNKQVNEILVSPQILSLRENITRMTQEVEMYESLMSGWVRSFDPDKIAE